MERIVQETLVISTILTKYLLLMTLNLNRNSNKTLMKNIITSPIWISEETLLVKSEDLNLLLMIW